MAMYGKVRINPESEHSVHSVWSFIQYVLETIIFILTGGNIGYRVFADEGSTIDKSDWIKMFIFYFIMTGVRYIVIICFRPLMTKSGYPVTMKDCIILTYGGLRGAIALCLGLMVFVDEGYPKRFRDLVIFYLIGMITLTVLFNGLTMKLLMEKIGFNPVNPMREKVKDTIYKSLVLTSIQTQEKIKSNKFLTLVEWEEVNKISGIERMIEEIQKKEGEINKAIELQGPNADINEIGNETEEVRYRVYRLLKSQFWERFEDSFCSSSVVNILIESIDFCVDQLEEKIWIYESISANILSADSLKSMVAWSKTFLIGSVSKFFLSTQLLNTYQLLSTLIISMEELIENKPQIPLTQKFVNAVFIELNHNKEKAEKHLVMMTDLFPDLIATIQEKQAAHMVLNSQKKKLKGDYHEGTINEEEYQEIIQKLDNTISRINYRGYNWNVDDIDEFKIVTPMFQHLSEDDRFNLKENVTKKKFPPGATIYKKNEPINNIHIIVSGLVEDSLNLDLKIRSGMGSILHWVNIITADGKAKTTLTAINETTTYMISKQVIDKILDSNRDFEDMVYKSSVPYLLKLYPPANMFMKLEDQNIHHICQNSYLITKQVNEDASLDYGGFLISGEVKLMDDSAQGNVPTFGTPQLLIPYGNKPFIVTKKCKILKFNENILDQDGEGGGSFRRSVYGGGIQQPGGNNPIRGSVRNSILNIINREKDLNRAFEDVVRRKYRDTGNHN